jgi:hypothetical protein
MAGDSSHWSQGQKPGPPLPKTGTNLHFTWPPGARVSLLFPAHHSQPHRPMQPPTQGTIVQEAAGWTMTHPLEKPGVLSTSLPHIPKTHPSHHQKKGLDHPLPLLHGPIPTFMSGKAEKEKLKIQECQMLWMPLSQALNFLHRASNIFYYNLYLCTVTCHTRIGPQCCIYEWSQRWYHLSVSWPLSYESTVIPQWQKSSMTHFSKHPCLSKAQLCVPLCVHACVQVLLFTPKCFDSPAWYREVFRGKQESVQNSLKSCF